MRLSQPGAPLERAADAEAERALRGEVAAPATPQTEPHHGPWVQRDEERSFRAGMALAGLDDPAYRTPRERLLAPTEN